jgi:hypothetical protein
MVWMNFTVEDSMAHRSNCELTVFPRNTTTDLYTWSWFAQKCLNAGWRVSWGYNEAGWATLTVVR